MTIVPEQAEADAAAGRTGSAVSCELIPAPFLTIDREGTILRANLAATRLVGNEGAGVVGTSLAHHFVSGTRTALLAFLARTFASGTTEQCEVELIREGVDAIAIRLSGVASDDRREASLIAADITAQTRTAMDLRHKTAFLEALVNASIDGILVVDEQGKKTLQNQRTCDLFKIPAHIANDDDNRPQLEYVTQRAKSPKEFLEKVLHLIEHPNETCRDECELDDGTILDRYSAPTLGADGTNYGRIWTFRDISERKQAESALLDNRRRLSLALESGGMGVWHWDIPEDRRWLDEQACRLLGLDPAAFRGTASEFMGAVHPDDRAKVRAALQRTIEEDVPYEVEYKVLWADGSRHDLIARGRLVRDGAGQPSRLHGVIWDQSKRLQAEQALQESEERFRQMTELFPETILETDASGRITYANGHGLEKHGYSRVDLERGVDLVDLACPEDRPRVRERFHERMANKTGGFLEFKALRSNGETFDALAYSAPIRARERNIGIRGFVLDISERKQAERDLRKTSDYAKEMAAQAMHANAAKSEFLANMSHEIRTPMNGVVGLTQLLLDTELTPSQRRYAETIRTSSEALLAVINDILDFSKIEAGKLTLDLVDFDLRSLVADLEASLAPRAAEKGIGFSCDVSPEVPSLLRGDPGRLRQILVNLADNGVKFTERGQVAVIARVDEETKDGFVLRFCVRDTGCGVSPQKTGLLFQKFIQADTSTTRRYGGTGLGLAISKQLAELMGGGIGLQSEEGRGSEFWFTSRFAKASSGHPRNPQAETTHLVRQRIRDLGRPDLRVLLAEDNATNQLVALGILAKLGLHAEVVSNGRQAVEALRASDYDLVLMDVQMPEMDGLEATRIIRTSGNGDRSRAVRIIAMTAHAMGGDKEECLAAGMDDYMTKPISPARLSAMIEKWSPRHRPPSTLTSTT